MRWLLVLGLLGAMVFPAEGAKRVTTEQLEQELEASIAGRKQDADMVRLIGDMELSERLTDSTLTRLTATLNARPRVAVALRLLADQSDFLDPPASELPTVAAPDESAQQRMLGAARSYVVQTLPRLPNLLATRTTNRYDDSPRVLKEGAWPIRAGLHLVDTSSSEISIRDERENQSLAKGSGLWHQQMGLVSGGEFGSTLGMILADADKGQMAWSHWEETSEGLAAVFRYEVPKSVSHYEVISSYDSLAPPESGNARRGGAGGVSSAGVKPNSASANASIMRIRPGYHGSIWIDASTGTILRITMEADLKQGAPFRWAAIMVQYGPVRIGGSTFFCPVRSVAISKAVVNAQVTVEDRPTEWLNETLFTNYHRFASTTKIVADTDAAKPQSSGQENSTPKQ